MTEMKKKLMLLGGMRYLLQVSEAACGIGVGWRCRCTVDGMFKSLIVWQKAMELVKAVYALTKQFPSEERYALTDQIRRAVISIPSNIAEGNGRASNADYGHILSIARGLLYETMTQLQVAVKYGSLRCTPTPSTCT